MPETEFTYREVSDEYSRLGFSYPSDDEFTEEEIKERVAGLSSHYLTSEVALLSGEVHSPDVLRKFSELAHTLNAQVTVSYNSLKIMRDTTAEERRKSALSLLKSSKDEQQRETARQSLRSAMTEL